MIQTSAGHFEVTISDGYPYFTEIRYINKDLQIRIPHTEISDLQYCIDKAVRRLKSQITEKEKGEI